MSLKERLIRQIRMDGPMPVSAYMQTCLHDPADGYYANGAGLGKDFITAPETSQMFGELLGLWLVNEWREMGEPDNLVLAEMGPGRGTLMADMLRTISPFLPDGMLRICLVEASPVLRDIQRQTLAKWDPNAHVSGIGGKSGIPGGPMLLIANEFLDCLPARQFVQEGENWRERIVGLGENGELAFGVDRSDLTAKAASDMPPVHLAAEAELQPGLDGLIDALIVRHEQGAPFHALFIDYGPADRSPGDTLRAYKNGNQVDPLACPGEADLTADVDFARLARLAAKAGLHVSGPVTQSAFLARLGLQERLNALIKAHPEQAEALFAGAQKLVDPGAMGERFKVICLSSPGLPAPAGFG